MPGMVRCTARCCSFLGGLMLIAGLATAAQPGPTPGAIPWTALDAWPAELVPRRPAAWPARSRAFRLDERTRHAILARAPLEDAPAASRPAELSLPMPDGRLARFAIVEAPIMEAALADRLPDIRTYRGTGLDDPTAT